MSRAALWMVCAALCAAGAASARIADFDMDQGDLRANASGDAWSASGAKYKCGTIHTPLDACYPRAKKGGLMSSASAACSVTCTKGLSCNCPVKGESCTSMFSKNPGLIYVGGMI
ncbi:unnamed protein product [Prorocentrum cordatum]|uniref:Uncharacterized protein n=1 Tax=Prorocentrum cordatum TaxID=2364126 RepID=A0ABN9VEP9_9DINO|nr:unnamed protein product [Polarella glacialis]